jgi:hypothetical protein
MRTRITLPALFTALGIAVAECSHAAAQPGQATLRAWVGFNTLALGDINNKIKAEHDAFLADTLVDESRWDPLGGAPELGGELEVQISPTWSASLGFSRQRSSVRHEMLRVFSLDPDTGEPAEIESNDETLQIKAWDVVGSLIYWVPSAPGLHFGGQVGVVRATYTSDHWYLIDTNTILPDMINTFGEFKGTGAVLGAFTGYQQSLTPHLGFTSRVGYRYRNVDEPKGNTLLTQWGDQGNAREWEFGSLLDSTGRTMGADLSGFYFKVGLSLTIGAN